MNCRSQIYIAVGLVLLWGARADAQQMAEAHTAVPQQNAAKPKAAPAASKHKVGAFDISINWRTRLEGWNWFEGNTGNSDYALGHSQLRLGIGQTRERFNWLLEAEQATILGAPNDAVVAAPQGQLGLGGTYYAANGNRRNSANMFVKQAFVQFKNLGNANLKLGRFEYFDGLELKSKDPTVATLVATRISQRLIANFGFAAVQRTFDGAQLSWNAGKDNVTLYAARPTRGVFQVDGMGELDVDVFYGAFNAPVQTAHGAGQLRVFALGYIDHRTLVLKTDNRPAAVRAADRGKIELATWGADYVHVFNTKNSGKFDVLGWGVIQTGSWGAQTQRASAFVGEFGWQPPVKTWKTWVSAG